MPISALSQWLKDNALSLVGMLVLIALSVSLAWQSAELLRLVRSPIEQPSSPIAPSLEQHTLAPTAQLFGAPRHADNGPPPATNLQLTLLGSFVHSDSHRSSAVIQRQGQSAQRYTIGMDVDNGVRLDAVYADRVELVRNGRRESLTFPHSQNRQYRHTPPVEAAVKNPLQPLSQLDQGNLEQLRQRMQALREQMEASGTLPVETSSDQLMESN